MGVISAAPCVNCLDCRQIIKFKTMFQLIIIFLLALHHYLYMGKCWKFLNSIKKGKTSNHEMYMLFCILISNMSLKMLLKFIWMTNLIIFQHWVCWDRVEQRLKPSTSRSLLMRNQLNLTLASLYDPPGGES